MIIDNTAGLQFLLSEDIYLVRSDMDNMNVGVSEIMETITDETITLAEPVELYVPAVAEIAEPASVAPEFSFSFIGKNQKGFLILCFYPDEDTMEEKHLEALTGALKRKELSLDDVAILNIANYKDTTIARATEYFKPERLLILGKTSLVAGWDKFTPNQLEKLDDITALYTFNFAQMLGDRERTKIFWEQMKAL